MGPPPSKQNSFTQMYPMTRAFQPLWYNQNKLKLILALVKLFNLTCRQNFLRPNFSLLTDHPQLQSEEDLGTCAHPYARRHLAVCLQLGSNVAFPNSQPFLKQYIKFYHKNTNYTRSSPNSSSINCFFFSIWWISSGYSWLQTIPILFYSI